MASSTDSLFITYVDAFGDLLKIWGQRNRTCATYVDKQLMHLMPEFNRMPGPPASSIRKGMLCFAKCSDDKYYRARVSSDVFNNTVTVVFIDYGHKDRVDLSNIRLQNGSTDGVISTIVSQADEFFLANVGSRGGWFQEVLNEVRRDLCYKEYSYTLKHQYRNERFIQINYNKEDYASVLLRRNIAIPVPVTDQALFLRYAFKNQEQMGNHCMPQPNQMTPQMGQQMMSKLHPEQAPSQSHIPVNPVQTPVPQTGFLNNMNQNPGFNRNNNNVAQTETKVTSVLNNVMIEALADQLKQHLFKESGSTTPETTSCNYVTQVLEVGTTHNIYVSYIDDGPWSFSIQLVASEHDLNQLMDELAACDLIPIKLPVVLGYPCIAKSKQYDNYCRGVVINISHSAVKIFFVDFGNTEDLPVTSIFELPVRFIKVKAMSQKFALSGLQKIKPSPEIKKAFVEVVENELLLLHVTTLEGENLPTCDLYLKNVNIKRILNEKVLQMRKWTPLQPPQQGEVEHVVVTWIDSPQKFFVQLKRNDRELENLKTELAQWGASGEFFHPDELVPGALCVCCFTGDNEWYRAIVTSINSKNSVTVFYVDYGNIEEVRPNAIKRIGNGLIRQLNSQAIQCCLHGFENDPADHGIKTVLEALILEKELCLRVIYTDKDRIIVKLFDKDNDISLSLVEKKTSKSHPHYAGMKEQTIKNIAENIDAGNRRNNMKSTTPPSRNRSEEKSWRKKEERSPRSDVSSEGGWRSDDSRKDGKDDRREKNNRHFFRERGKTTFSRRETGNEDKNWRNKENVDMKNMNEKRSERGQCQSRLKPAESVMERARRAAKETQERGMKMHDMNVMRYPVKLENMALHGATFMGKDIPIGSVEEVIVTYFLNPNEIYVQLLSTKEDFRKVMDEIQNYYATKLPVANFPKKGDVVIAKFKGDEVLYRASIIESNPLTVRYVDYGNEEVTERERLWPMDKNFLKLEAQAIKCCLPNLLPNGADTWPLPEAQIDKIFEFETYSCRFLSCTGSSYEVRLTILENGKDVRDELISVGFAVPAENKNGLREGVKQCPSLDLTLMRNDTFKVHVSHVVDPSEFYIQLELDTIQTIEEEARKCSVDQKLMPHLDSNCVSVGGLYFANIGGDSWRRVKILKKTENTAFVQLIDHGDKLDVAYEEIKPAADYLWEHTSQAVQCCLYSETEGYSGDVAEAFKECDKNVFICYVHDVLENKLRVTLYDTEGEKLEFLRNLNDASDVVRPNTTLPITKQGIIVIASHITSPKEIYIQRISDIPALEELSAAMLEFYNIGGEDLETGTKICAAKSTADKCWYRARVLMSAEDRAKVFYIDFGNTEEVPLENLKKLDPAYGEKCAFCRKISLNVDYDADLESEISSKLCGMVADKECMGYFAKVDDTMYGELIVDEGAVSDQLLSDRVKRVRDGMFGDVLAAKKIEEVIEKDFGVFISHVSSPSEFWIHHESISNELEAFQNMLQNACLNAAPKKDIQVGDVVGSLFTDQLWYRSKVVNIDDNVLLIQFIDYGNSLKINFSSSEIVELEENVVKVTPFASFCSLKGQWKETAALRFEEIITINQEPFNLVELGGENPRIVDLVQNGVSVTEQLISEGYEGTSGDDLDDDDVYITHINTPNDFYIQRDGDKSLFDTLISGLLEADMFENVEDVKENEIYCAKFPENEMWYRAKILKRNENGIYVHFIDYGNNCTVTDMKILPPEFLTIPPLSLNCSLIYGQSNDFWSEAACKKFTEYISNSAFRMEVVLQAAERSVVKLFTEDCENVTEILEKLCEPDGREYVCITHINSPSDFYVRRVDNKYFNLINERLKGGEEFEDMEKKEIGMLCAAKYEDGVWYRAEMRNICDDAYDVFFVDHGNTWLASEVKSLPDDIKGIEPLAKNCCLDFRVTNIPESIKEEFIQLTEQNVMLRARVVQPGDRDLVSLMLDGMKLEEVLLYPISETCEIYNIQLDVENQSTKKTETDEKSSGDEFQISEGYQDGNFEDDVRAGNETDEEKRVKFAIITSENTEGFRSDDEKGIMECYGLSSSVVNVPDNELLSGTVRETVDMDETGEVAGVSEMRLNGTPVEDDTFNPNDEDTSTNTSKYYFENHEKPGVSRTATATATETEYDGEKPPEDAVVGGEVINSIETSSPQQKVLQDGDQTVREVIPHDKVAFDDKIVAAALNGTTEDGPN